MIGDLKEENNSNTIYENQSNESKDKSKNQSDNANNNEKSESESVNGNQIFAISKDKRHFKCDFCGKLFKENGNLKTHLRLHSGVKPFICKFINCGKRFVTLGNLKSHEFNHTEKKPFKCIVQACGKLYSRQCRLDIHLRTHYNLKPYKCPYEDCDKSFNEKGNLKTHVRIHTGEKPFVCDFPDCGMSFKAHGHLKDHRKRHTNYRPYKCHLCNNSFARSSTLKIHLHTHQGDKPHKCPFPNCNKSFTERGNMKTHYKNHLEQRKTLEDLDNPQELFKSKKLRLATFKENPFKKPIEEEKKNIVINLNEIPLNENLKNENVKILKNLENLKNIIEKQDKQILESTKTDSRRLKLKNPNLVKEINRKRQKVKVLQFADNANNFSFNNIANNNSFINPSVCNNINQLQLSMSEIGSKNSINSNMRESNKLNFSFSEAVEIANSNKANEKSEFKNLSSSNDNINNNNNIIKDELDNVEKNNKRIIDNEEIKSENFNFRNLSKFSQNNKSEFSLLNQALEKKEALVSQNFFNFSKISNQALEHNFGGVSESNLNNNNNNPFNKINVISELNLHKAANSKPENSLISNNNPSGNFANFANLSSSRANSNFNNLSNINNNNIDNKIISKDLKTKSKLNSEDNLLNFSNLSNLKELKNFNNINNNQNPNFNQSLNSNNNNSALNNNNNKYLTKKTSRDSISIKSHNTNTKDDNDLFLKPKDVSSPMAHLERLLNENNNREDLVNFGKLTSMRSNFNFSSFINNNNVNQDLNNNNNNNTNIIINNNNLNLNTNNINGAVNINSLTNSNSSGKNASSGNDANKENANCANNLNLNENNFQREINGLNNSKNQPIFNFNQISSFNFMKNPIEQTRGTPANLNTISSIHSNNLERNHAANVNFELMLKNYANQNSANYSAFNACAGNNSIINNNNNNLYSISNATNANQNIISNIASLNNLYSLNSLINSANNDNNNIINLISQSPRNLNLNNSSNSITSPKNLICNLMQNPGAQAQTNLSALANNITLNPLAPSSNANINPAYANNSLNKNNNNINLNSNNNTLIVNHNNSDFFNFMNLSGGLNFGGGIPNKPHCIGSTPISQQNNYSNLNIINNPITPSAGNGFLNLSEISKYRSQLNADYNNNLSQANSSILNYNMGNSSSTNINNNNAFNCISSSNNAAGSNSNFISGFSSDFTSTPIRALRKHLNEINISNNFKLNDNALENEGERTCKSLCSNRSNQVNIDEVNQMYNNLISKMQIIKNAKPEYYKECCDNYRNLILDSEKRIYIVLKIICDYERLYQSDYSNSRTILNNYITNLNSNQNLNNSNNIINNNINNGNLNNFSELNSTTNRNSTATFGGASTIKLDDFSSKNLNTLTNMNSTNNVTSCKSSPWVNAGNVNSFGDLVMNYSKKLGCNSKIHFVGNEGISNRNVNNNQSFNIVSPSQLNKGAENFLNFSNYADSFNKDTSPINHTNNQILNRMTNQMNLSNIYSPVSMPGNVSGRNIQSLPIKRVPNQPTFSDFVKNIPNKFNQ